MLIRTIRISSINAIKRSSSTSTSSSFRLPESRKSAEKPIVKDTTNPLLYSGCQSFNIRLMTSLGVFNTLYWSVSFATMPAWTNSTMTMADMFSLSYTSPLWTSIGFACTGGIFYLTKTYADRVIYIVYENSETKRLG